jgi:hypothetical protein
MSDERFETGADLGDAEGHLFIPTSAREREIDDADDAEGHAINHRPLDKGRPD